MKKVNIAVLVSGGGTNLQAIIDAEKSGIIKNGSVKLVVSNKSGVYALERAKNSNIQNLVILKKDFESQTQFENEIIKTLDDNEIDLVVLAGFMSILSENFTNRYNNRILNVHPSLIPKYCGKGFYGIKVHQAVLENNEKETGATVHFVNEIPDGGEIIIQKSVKVDKNDSAESLKLKVMKQAEWIIYPQAIEKVAKRILEVSK